MSSNAAPKSTNPTKRKTQLCRHWLRGTCNKDDCNYAHGKEELAHPKMSNNHLKHQNNHQQNGQGNMTTFNKTGLLFKTSLCNKFMETGNCPYGSRCRFAHGKQELKKKPDMQDPNTTYILELEKENSKLKSRIRELEGVLQGHGIMMPGMMPPTPQQMQQMQQAHQQQQQQQQQQGNFRRSNNNNNGMSRQQQQVFNQLGQLSAQVGAPHLMNQQMQQQQQQIQQQQQQINPALAALSGGAADGGQQSALLQAQLLQLLLQGGGLANLSAGGSRGHSDQNSEDESEDEDEDRRRESSRRSRDDLYERREGNDRQTEQINVEIDPNDPNTNEGHHRSHRDRRGRGDDRQHSSRKNRHVARSRSNDKGRERDYHR